MKKIAFWVFYLLVCLSLLAPFWVFKDLLFPYVTSKAFYFRICIEAALPFYCYFLVIRPDLRPKWRRQPLNWLMVVFVLLNLISAFSGIAVIRSIWGNFERMGGVFYIGTLTLLYFYILMIGQAGGNFIKRFLQVFLVVALVVTVNAILSKILGYGLLVQDPSLPARASSTLGNPIYLGSFLVIPIFLSMFFGSQAGSVFKKWMYYFFAFLFLIGVVLSGTRGANVGLVGGVFLSALVYIVLTKNRKIKTYGIAAVLAFAALCGVLFMFSNKLPAGSDFKRLFTLKDSNTQARLIQWGVALKGYKDHPLFGVGPENYYFIANAYYNPAIFNYDRSWFDKPHNYLIEILVTDGIFAFLAYMAILALIAAALYKGYASGFLTLFEFCVLLAGLLVYQIQNLTVFDTIPASLAFYSLTGFAGYIWYASKEQPKKNRDLTKSRLSKDPALAGAVFVVCAVVVSYGFYATVIAPMEVAKAVNYGSAYAGVDPAESYGFFQRAFSLPFNFDKTESAQKYADSAIAVARSATPQTQVLSNNFLSGAVSALNEALAVEPSYPILWQELAEVYLYKGIQNDEIVSVDPRAEVAARRGVALAPGRQEPALTLAQILSSEGQQSAAEAVVQGLIQEFPTDPTLPAQLSSFYRFQGNIPKAVALMQQAESDGYTFSSVDSMAWLVQYYESQKQYQQALDLLKQGVAVEPGNLDAQTDLAKLYALTGQKQQAISLAESIMKSDPTRQSAMQQFIAAVSAMK